LPAPAQSRPPRCGSSRIGSRQQQKVEGPSSSRSMRRSTGRARAGRRLQKAPRSRLDGSIGVTGTDASTADVYALVGGLLGEHYRVVRVIGQGGMGWSTSCARSTSGGAQREAAQDTVWDLGWLDEQRPYGQKSVRPPTPDGRQRSNRSRRARRAARARPLDDSKGEDRFSMLQDLLAALKASGRVPLDVGIGSAQLCLLHRRR